MRFNEIIMEGGRGVEGVGSIHIDEIGPTLRALESKLGIDLQNNALGSVGKKEFSGDMDVALNIPAEEIPEFIKKLESIPEIIEVNKASVIMTKVKIINYDPNKKPAHGGPRTGFVQLDFMPGDPDWMKVYYHSPYEKDSKYKGAHRNWMLASIASVYNSKASAETTDDGRPLEVERYLWSPRDGLVRVIRKPKPANRGGYTKANVQEIIAGPWKTANEIAQELNLGSADALDSFETLLRAVDTNYPTNVHDEIFRRVAKMCVDTGIEVPAEVKDYL